MKSLHVISSLTPEGGGPTYTVPRLAKALNDSGSSSSIATLSVSNKLDFRGVPISVYAPDADRLPYLRKLGLSQDMMRGLLASKCDVFHCHGLWMMPNIYPSAASKRSSRPLVISPRGMLGPEALKYSKWKKSIFWALCQQGALKQASCIHATSESELSDIRKIGIRNPVAVIPNGVDIPASAGRRLEYAHPYVLALTRFHPKKGLDILISAFSRVSRDFPNWDLRIVGFDAKGYGDQLKRLAHDLGVGERVSIEGPVLGEAKSGLMREASIFALPSLNENFAMTVAESLALETPVIASRGSPWSGLVTYGCGWWVDHGVSPLESGLRGAMKLTPSARSEMGKKGRLWVEKDFNWERIAKQMSDLYDWVLDCGPRPSFVFD